MAGHVLSARDCHSPIAGARLVLDFREITTRLEGHFEVPLDALPVEVELEISAPGFHPLRETLNWAPIASGGLILRDFYLTPLDMPAPAPRRPRLDAISFEMPPARGSLPDTLEEEELDAEGAEELGLQDFDDDLDGNGLDDDDLDGDDFDDPDLEAALLDDEALEGDLDLEVVHHDEGGWLSLLAEEEWDEEDGGLDELESSFEQPMLLAAAGRRAGR